jgi:hypothetical protein
MKKKETFFGIYSKKSLIIFLIIAILIGFSTNVNASQDKNTQINKKSWVTIEEDGQIRISTVLIFPINIRGTFRSDAIDSQFNINNITVGYGGEIIGDYTKLENIGFKDLNKVENYNIRILETPEGQFKTIESNLSIEGSKDKPGIAYFGFYLNESLNDSENIILNLQNTMPTMKGEEIDFNAYFGLVSHKKSAYGTLRKAGEHTLNESMTIPSLVYTSNGFYYTIDGKTKETFDLLYNQIDIKQIKNCQIDVFENWTIENKNETYYHIIITVTTKSNSSWPFHHVVSPGIQWLFNPLQKPENLKESSRSSVRFIKDENETGQLVGSKFCISCDSSLQNLNISEIPADIFMVPDIYGDFLFPYRGKKSFILNRTISIEFDSPKSELNRFSTGNTVEYNWISSLYQKQILLKSDDYFFSTQPYDIEYSKEGYIFTKERNLIGASEQLFKGDIVSSVDALANTTKESSSTSLDVFEIRIPETKTASYLENAKIFIPNTKLITASINTKEERSIHSDKENITVIVWLYSVDDIMGINIKMKKPYKIEDFGQPINYYEILKDPKNEMELNQLYVDIINPQELTLLFPINRQNKNRTEFEIDYSSNLSSAVSFQRSLKIWEPIKWKLKYEKVFPPGEFPGFTATTTFNLPDEYQIVGTGDGGKLEGDVAKFISPLNENFTARKVMEIYFVSKAEKVNKEFFWSKFGLLLLISFSVIIILKILSRFKHDFGIIKKLIPFLISILFIQFSIDMPPSFPLLWTGIYLITFLIILYLITQRYSKGLITDVRSSIKKQH